MRILHTESSSGWGGQEIRILREAEGMRKRGHHLVFAVQIGGKLVARARDAGFTVYELPFSKPHAFKTVYKLVKICRTHQIQLVNTHSSLDAWLGGIAARFAGVKIIRTRHLSTPTRGGLNSRLLYKTLADFVVTTSSCIIPSIATQGRIPLSSVQCVPTGIDPATVTSDLQKAFAFRDSLGLKPSDILVGTLCVVRSWKGILDLFQAATLLKKHPHIKWVIVGGGYLDDYKPKLAELGLEGIVTFTGHLENPFDALQAIDIFTLLSTAHEGISQASLQAAYLQKPLITTSIGGLPEVCLSGQTGIVVPPFSSDKVAEAVLRLAEDPQRRSQWGRQAKELVMERFTFEHTLHSMESIYNKFS